METTPPSAEQDAELRTLAAELEEALSSADPEGAAPAAVRTDPEGLPGETSLSSHRTLAGIFTIVLALGLLITTAGAAVLLMLMGDLDVLAPEFYPIVAVWGAISGLAIAAVVAGVAFMRGRRAARVPMWGVALVSLPFFPVGTGLGAYLIWVLVRSRELP